ncbi:unnamed protein product [Chrysoparadoxa australica]
MPPYSLPLWLPIIGGHTLDAPVLRMGSWMESQIEKLGSDIEFYMLGFRVVTVSRLEDITRMLNSRPTKFIKPRQAKKTFEELGVDPWLFTEEGRSWGKVRRLTAPSFSQANVEMMLPDVVTMAEQVMGHVDGLVEKRKPVEVVDIYNKAALSVVSIVGMGHDMHLFEPEKADLESYAQIRNVFNMIFCRFFDLKKRITWYLPFQSWVTTYKRRDAVFNKMVDGLVADVKEANKKGIENTSGRGLLLRKLVAASAASGKEGGLSDEQIRTNIKGYFVAGTDTTSRLMSFLTYSLASDPARQARVQKEIDDVLGGRPYPETYEDYSSLVYLQACVKEALRLRGPAHRIQLCSLVDWTMKDGREYPAETYFSVLISACMRKEENFSRAHEYIPERWIDEEREALLGADCAHNERCFLSFGGGPRLCPGMGLAMMEAAVFVGSLFKNYDISMPKGHPEVNFVEDITTGIAELTVETRGRRGHAPSK